MKNGSEGLKAIQTSDAQSTLELWQDRKFHDEEKERRGEERGGNGTSASTPWIDRANAAVPAEYKCKRQGYVRLIRFRDSIHVLTHLWPSHRAVPISVPVFCSPPVVSILPEKARIPLIGASEGTLGNSKLCAATTCSQISVSHINLNERKYASGDSRLILFQLIQAFGKV